MMWQVPWNKSFCVIWNCYIISVILWFYLVLSKNPFKSSLSVHWTCCTGDKARHSSLWPLLHLPRPSLPASTEACRNSIKVYLNEKWQNTKWRSERYTRSSAYPLISWWTRQGLWLHPMQEHDDVMKEMEPVLGPSTN